MSSSGARNGRRIPSSQSLLTEEDGEKLSSILGDVKARAEDRLVEHFGSSHHKGATLEIFVVARLFADHHDPRAGFTLAE